MASKSKGVPTDEALRDLALRARGGDKDAAYEILGEQVPTDTWLAVVEALAREPEGVDLEVVAHRTLRRPPAELQLVVLALARAVGTAHAAFLARAIAALRTEEHVVVDAERVRAELSARNPPVDLLADDRPPDALFAILALPLREQAEILGQIGAADPARAALMDALRVEYERLQQLSKDQRWRSGSYRHFLRHALADLALIAHVGGKLEDQAYRLLQQRTEVPERNRELLALLPEETRKAYLSWVVDRPPGKEETARALFALGELEQRYPDDVDSTSVARLLGSRDDAIGVAAAGLLARVRPDDGSIDRALGELVALLPIAERTTLIGQVARDAPGRIRLDLWPSDADRALAEIDSAGVTRRLLETFEDALDPTVRERALELLRERLDEDVATRVAFIALQRSTDPDAPDISTMLGDSKLRAGLWTGMRSFEAVPQRLLAALIELDTSAGAAAQLVALHGLVPPPLRATIEGATLAGLERGTVSAEPLLDSELAEVLTTRAAERLQGLERRVEQLRELVSHGDQAAEIELDRELRLIVTRAIERSTGNERLTEDYRRLLIDGAEEPAVVDGLRALDPGELDILATSLAKAGFDISAAEGNLTTVIAPDASDMTLLRALAIADQRCERAPERSRSTAQRVRDAVAQRLAEAGLGERAMRDLVEGGPLAPPTSALPPTARTALFNAASDAGFQPPAAWSQHPIVGQWLSALTASDGVQGEDDPLGTLAALERTATELRATEARLAESRAATRQAFMESAETVLSDIEETFDAYIQLWLGLERLGIGRIAALGQVIPGDDIDPQRHEVMGDVRTDRYIVRFAGVIIGDEIFRRARVEASQ